MFELSAFAREVHENAVAHGWWDAPRGAPGIRALIHSEWSEALEEARAGRPMMWHRCDAAETKGIICEEDVNCPCKKDRFESDCPVFDPKPEGIAVELIDGVIRILDYLAYTGDLETEVWNEGQMSAEDCMEYGLSYCARAYNKPVVDMDIENVVAALHELIAGARQNRRKYMLAAVGVVFAWVRHQGLNPEMICVQKHRYNKTRPYKHGKKF